MAGKEIMDEQASSTLPAAETRSAEYNAVKNTRDSYYDKLYQLFVEGDDRPSRRAVTEENAILFPTKRLRDLPGVGIGHQFLSRGEMAAVGFHSHGFKEVDYGFQDDFLPHEEYADYTFPIATSIVVLSTLFEEELYYTSQSSQEFEDRILALKNNEEQNVPIRLIRKHIDEAKSIYTYDGLFNVVKPEEGVSSGLTYVSSVFEGQHLTISQDRFLFNHPFGDLNSIDGLCCDDITSADPEKIPIIATNNGGDCPLEPTNFTYSNSLVFAKNVKRPKITLGCKCEGDCSDPKTCPCAQSNGTYPYRSVQDGSLRNSTKRIIYECGEHCGCGSSCRNKVFHAPHKGWGVRTLDLIPKGAYLGEYIGVIRRDEDAGEELENVYLFDIDPTEKNKKTKKAKYCIDGEKVGNFVRFIYHSCEPNLFIQSVLSDHRDVNLARIVLFSDTNRDILPMEELTYDYGYKIDSVEVNGVIKKMKCRCAAKTCRGRLM
ncbi:histone-lysine N-methyltransferase, H3 lysine-9 specific SUVH4-like [Papaver somniferum]|uniref:histone-lysine N-methyltransferase, H3 lysine-9 specific SUVH4-like n=1 Tax=Papaver somniferum TaxID=3469 RepID=UPI000E6F7EB2|nr:histone-lysine N-methyltransferase, H3 lysine-9 specific SUVH4-like [Papaver somniferum]